VLDFRWAFLSPASSCHELFLDVRRALVFAGWADFNIFFLLMPLVLRLHRLYVQAVANGVHRGGGPNHCPISRRVRLSGTDAWVCKDVLKWNASFFLARLKPSQCAPRVAVPFELPTRALLLCVQEEQSARGEWGWGCCSLGFVRRLVWADKSR